MAVSDGADPATLEQELAAALGARIAAASRIGELTVSLVPLRVHVGSIVIGAEPPLATVSSLDARLWALASLAEGRPVVSAQIIAPILDFSHLPKAEPGASQKNAASGMPPLHVRKLEVTDAQLLFRMGNTPAKLTVARLAGQMKTGLLRAGLSAGLEASGVELERKGYRAHIDEIHADGGADAGGLFVNSASVQGKGIVASVHATTTAHRHAASRASIPASSAWSSTSCRSSAARPSWRERSRGSRQSGPRRPPRDCAGCHCPEDPG